METRVAQPLRLLMKLHGSAPRKMTSKRKGRGKDSSLMAQWFIHRQRINRIAEVHRSAVSEFDVCHPDLLEHRRKRSSRSITTDGKGLISYSAAGAGAAGRGIPPSRNRLMDLSTAAEGRHVTGVQQRKGFPRPLSWHAKERQTDTWLHKSTTKWTAQGSLSSWSALITFAAVLGDIPAGNITPVRVRLCVSKGSVRYGFHEPMERRKRRRRRRIPINRKDLAGVSGARVNLLGGIWVRPTEWCDALSSF